MRTIKFRGKNCFTGEWLYGSLIQSKDSKICAIVDIESLTKPFNEVLVVPETVGQFTGSHDVNGNEIYEGDIIERPADNLRMIILFYEGWNAFMMSNKRLRKKPYPIRLLMYHHYRGCRQHPRQPRTNERRCAIMTTEEELRGNMPIKQFDELVKTLKDEYGITMNERPQRIGEIRLAPIDYTSPQAKFQDWRVDELCLIPLPNLPKTFYVIKQPKPTRWQRFKNKIKKLIK